MKTKEITMDHLHQKGESRFKNSEIAIYCLVKEVFPPATLISKRTNEPFMRQNIIVEHTAKYCNLMQLCLLRGQIGRVSVGMFIKVWISIEAKINPLTGNYFNRLTAYGLQIIKNK